jgi:hypothetical protein
VGTSHKSDRQLPQGSRSSRYFYITACNLALWTSTQALPSGKRIKMRASNGLALISHSYAYIAGHGSALLKRTAPQRVYTASRNCKSFAGQPIRNSDFITYQHRSRLCQRPSAPIGQPATVGALPASLLATTRLLQRRTPSGRKEERRAG